MAIQQKLQARLSQKLILTPSLQQAIKLLPMTTLELVDMLNQELVENPLLDEMQAEEQQQADAAAQVEKADPDPQPTTEKQDTWDDADYEYFFGDYLDDGYRPRAPREVKELPPIENTLATVSSLSDHLMWQLTVRTDDQFLRDIGIAIIGNLDEDGYLVASIEEIASMGDWPETEVERVLSLVQAFDPVGVAARDLQECLLLQLHHLGLDNTPSEVIIREHLRLLPKPSSARDGASSRHDDRGGQRPHRRHPASRPQAGQSPQPIAVAVRHPRCLRDEGGGSVCRGAERGGAAAVED